MCRGPAQVPGGGSEGVGWSRAGRWSGSRRAMCEVATDLQDAYGARGAGRGHKQELPL